MSGIEASQSAAPSPTAWRRERLLRIGSSATIPTSAATPDGDNRLSNQYHPQNTPSSVPTDHSPLQRNNSFQLYGTLPTRRQPHHKPSSIFTSRHGLPNFDILRRSTSNPTTPLDSPSALRDYRYSALGGQRPISAYDEHFQSKDDGETDIDAKINGVRVWYSSFSSIDWLHDAIKDSVRFSRLRRRKSLRSRLRLLFDKSLGWLIVTIVGFLTALIAFFVVRSEQWLFDLKEGYCSTAWWKARRFCCPQLENEDNNILSDAEVCPEWTLWSLVFSQPETSYGEQIAGYVSYTGVALTLALISCLLTIYLTKSTTFVTRKESGIRGSEFSEHNNKSAADVETKRKVMYYAAGSGIPEIKTILSGFVIHGYLGGRTLFTKSVGLALSVASGLSLGKEGPFVHIASCVGNIVSRITNKYETNEAKRREILSAACAAGVAVAFGAPIGGTLFSLEEVSYFFPPKVMWRSFFCAMIAAITLKMLDPFGTGKLVLFQVTYDKDWHAYELIPFLFLGLVGGVYGAYFSKLNHRWSKHVRNATWMKSHPVSEVLLITFVTTLLCFLNPYTRMGGTELVYNLFSECRTGSRNSHSGLCIVDPGSFDQAWPVIKAISVAMLVKAILTIVTFGIKVPAGIFIPSLGVGACAGRVVGIIMQWLQMRNPNGVLFRSCGGNLDCIIPGLYAMVGAAATLSGVTRTTVSLAVIMFELTDTLTYAVPIMLSVLVAKTVADALEPKGIYDLVIELNQLPYLDSKHEYLWGNVQINDVISKDVEVIRLDRKNTVESLRDQLISISTNGNDDNGFPILRRDSNEEDMRMVGYIGANELEHALSIVADSAEEEVHFYATYSHDLAASSISSLAETAHLPNSDPFDFSVYMDEAPLTLQNNCPMEMVHQFFVKLGARYVVITDTDGFYEGVIDKKTWLAFLSGLEEK